MQPRVLFLFLLVLFSISLIAHSQVATLKASKHATAAALLPVPQIASFTAQSYSIDDSWTFTAAGIDLKSDPAVASLINELNDRFGVRIKPASSMQARVIQLLVKPGCVNIGKTIDTNVIALKEQAYRIKLESGRVFIAANAQQGLFYGVQTFIQSMKQENGEAYFTAGEITDWPAMSLRMIYWDDAHHLERLHAMKRAIRQASYYKINAFAVKLEGHFQFTSAKRVVEPNAYSPAEFQELTDYAKARYVELVPYLDAPAHIAFILKHPQYRSLRAFPSSNYELNVLDPKADELMMGMFDDLFDANRGGKYVLFSTDEAYYVGKSPLDKKRAGQLGGNGKLLAEYVTRISNKLHAKGRKVIIWAEYPLTVEDVSLLPSHIINGVYDQKWAPKVKNVECGS